MIISRSTRSSSGSWDDRPLLSVEREAAERKAGDGPFAALSAVAANRAAAETPGARVLSAAVTMVRTGRIVIGACWDFVNAVYNEAGYPPSKRITVFKRPETGPFADPGILRPGDWVIYRNLPYGEIGHSAVFVEWIDFEKRSALTIEYVGGNRKAPGQYREADLTKIWGILRGRE